MLLSLIRLHWTAGTGMGQAGGAGRRMEKKTVDNDTEPRIKFLIPVPLQ